MALALTAEDRAVLRGEAGPGPAFAMDLLAGYGASVGAPHLIDIVGAHIDGCLFHGQVDIDFVKHLVDLGARVSVPTTLNVGSIDLIHPELFRGDPAIGADGRRLMELHEALGCVSTFTCAPYQTMFRPSFGEQIAWGESNAIVFANSVIGARTARYGDFIDLAAAVVGRAPYAGLHVQENRRGEILFRLSPAAIQRPEDALAVAVGYIVGLRGGSLVPVIDGLPRPISEAGLKALGATAASSGAIALFHAVGITPEAPDLPTALGGKEPLEVIDIGPADIDSALAGLCTVADGTPIAAVALGTPHFSLAEFGELIAQMDGFVAAPGVDLYVNTARDTYMTLSQRGWRSRIESAGFTIVVDTCTYLTSVMREIHGAVITNSGKWAHYAPGNLGIEVAFGSLADCLASAATGRVTRVSR